MSGELTWAALGAAEREVMSAAAEECHLAELGMPTTIAPNDDGEPATAPGLALDEARAAVRMLLGAGLVGLFWRNRTGAPDLDPAEQEAVLTDDSFWCTPPCPAEPALYLAPLGEVMWFDSD